MVASVAGLVAVAAVLRFYRIGHQGFWFDEANTAQLMRFSPGKMLGLIPGTESTPPLYYCVAWIWARVWGDNEAGLRSLSAVAGVLVVPVAYAVGARLMTRRAGLMAAALTACSPLLIWYSQEARSYSLLVLLTALSLLAFAYARETPTPRHLTLWVLASALALATHYFAAVVVVPAAAWLLAQHRRRPAVRVAVAVVGACGLALIPLAISQNGTGHDGWIASAPFGLRAPPDRASVPDRHRGTGTGGAARHRGRAGGRRARSPGGERPVRRAQRGTGGRGPGAVRIRAQPGAGGGGVRRPHHPQHHRPVAARRPARRGRAGAGSWPRPGAGRSESRWRPRCARSA